ncbi:SpoIIE family protein phosphatase [Teredinibacter turnerae]|uniref:SpoIIE family protein phosphatase n=1 Tax=Teredinibacter turnerae TaxID=2426 RepID=UPI0030CF65A2
MSDRDWQLLVIDDDAMIRSSVVTYLEGAGFKVHHSSDGASGCEWLATHPVDLVITDLCMPDVDGLSILRSVKHCHPNLPVIVLSGVGVVRDVVEALRQGAADYLVKPLVDLEVLVHSVKRVLERQSLLHDNQRYREELEKANRDLREYVRLLEHDQKAGRRVQSKLLPVSPLTVSDITLSFEVIPSLYLSGDFIDYGFLSRRYLAFYLTDVSGHGAAPAFVTVWLNQLVRRLFREQRIFDSEESFKRDAASLLKLVNQEVIRSKIGCHLTSLVGVIDTQTREMRYVVAGHLPLPVLLVGDRCEYLPGKGKPLGFFEDGEWEINSVQLPENFTLAVFSDGILEVLPRQDLLAKEAYLLDHIATSHNPTARNSFSAASTVDLSDSFGLKNLEAVPDDIAILKITGGTG